jgi:hypothetical protein
LRFRTMRPSKPHGTCARRPKCGRLVIFRIMPGSSWRFTWVPQMKRTLELAKPGRGQLVAAVGEAGVGKSRLFFEFQAIGHSGCMVLETL